MMERFRVTEADFTEADHACTGLKRFDLSHARETAVAKRFKKNQVRRRTGAPDLYSARNGYAGSRRDQ
jgi:hypothetical protein